MTGSAAAATMVDHAAARSSSTVSGEASVCVSVAAKFMPAAGRKQTGDFLAIAHRSDNAVAVVVGDAGRRSSHARAAQRAAAAAVQEPIGPRDILERLNETLRRERRVASAVAVTVRPTDETMMWASAGPMVPLLLDSGQRAGTVVGSRLGELEHCDCRDQHLRIPEGGGLLLVTDGVLDAVGPAGERFGERRLARVVQMLAGQGPPCTVADVLRTVCHFAAHRLSDNAAAVAIRLP